MFPVGALNPVPYNTRREQLVQQLVNQLQQRRMQAAQQAVVPAAGYFDFQRKRQQMANALSAPTHPAGAGQATAMTALTAANNIPGFLMSGLGGATPPFSSNFSSPAPNVPVPNSPGGSGYNPGLQGSGPPGIGHASMLSPGSLPIPAYNQLPGSPIAALFGGYPLSNNPGGPVAGARGLPTMPGNVVPIGGGAYVNPSTSQVYGGRLVL